MRKPDLVVAGAGMAGLVAAAEAVSLGATVVVHEKGDRPGGSFRLSSGVVWRYRELADLLAECPAGDPDLQQLVHEHLDDDLAWLERVGATVTARTTRSGSTYFRPTAINQARRFRVGGVFRF